MLTPLISPDAAARVLKSLHSTKFEVKYFSSQSLGLLASLLDLNKISLELASYLEQSMRYLTAVYDSPTMLVKFKRYNSLINDTAESLGLNHQGEAEFYIALHAKLACRGLILDSRFKVVKHDGHEFAFFYIQEVFTVTSSLESKLSNLNLKEVIYLVTPRSDKTRSNKIENSTLGYAVSSTHDSIFCNLKIIRQKFQKFSDHVRWFTHFEDPGILFPTILDVCCIPLNMMLFAAACRLAPRLSGRSFEEYLNTDLKMSVLFHHLKKTRPELERFDFEVPLLLLGRIEGCSDQQLFERVCEALFLEQQSSLDSLFIQVLCKVLGKGFCNLAATNMLFDIPETYLQWHQTQYGSSYSMLDVYGDKIWKVILLNIPFVSDTLTKTLVEQVNSGLRLSKPIEKFQTCAEPGCPTESYITIFEGLIDYSELSNKLESAVYALVDLILISLRGGEKVLGCRFGLEQPIFTDGLSRSAWDVFELTAVNLTDYYEFILCLTTVDHPCRWNEVMSVQVSLKSSVPSTLRIRCRANSIWYSLSNVVMLLEDLVDQIIQLEINNIQAQMVKQFLRVCLEIISRVRHRPRAV